MAKLIDIPGEIRNQIYDLLLINHSAIHITSPRQNRARKVQDVQTHFANLMAVNKQINAETRTIFYSRNIFIIGNGQYGSTTEPNLHGLKAFIARVPQQSIALIRQVTLVLFFRYNVNTTITPLYHINEGDVSEFRTLRRAFLKYFTRAETLRVCFDRYTVYQSWVYHCTSNTNVFGCVAETVKEIQLVLKHPALKKFRISLQRNGKLSCIWDQVLKGLPEAKKMLCETFDENEYFPIIPHWTRYLDRS